MNTEKPENSEVAPPGQAMWPIMGRPRRVHVKGMQGVDATVVVTVVRDKVWLSISPAFTWEAIMEPGKVDEVISVRKRARDEATTAATTRNGNGHRSPNSTGRPQRPNLTDRSRSRRADE